MGGPFLNTLIDALCRVCRERRLDEKWLLAPTLRVGHQWLEQSARRHVPAVNVHVKTLSSMAFDLAAPEIAVKGVRPASRLARRMIAGLIFHRLKTRGLRYLDKVEEGTAFGDKILSSIHDLRSSGLPPARVASAPLEVAEKGEDLASIVSEYLRQLEEDKLLDYSAVLDMAITRLADNPESMGGQTLILVPSDLEKSHLERTLLGKIPSRSLIPLPVDEPPLSIAAPPRLEPYVGEVNEVRGVLRSCLAAGIPFDEVEILHTDRDTYVPLVYETLLSIGMDGGESDIGVPATFSEGFSCGYSRPGRALEGWLRWSARDFPQTRLVDMIREGDLSTGTGREEHESFVRLAKLFRRLPIGFGQDRYHAALSREWSSLRRRSDDRARSADEEGERSPDRPPGPKRDLLDLEILRQMVKGIFSCVPRRGEPATALIAGAKRFLRTCARSVNLIDAYAGKKLLEELDEMEDWLERARGGGGIDLREWLAAFPRETRVLGSGPRPGCLHVDHLLHGGHSGRPHTFVLGLDDGRFPGAGLQDPLLLDTERRSLSPSMPTAAARRESVVKSFHYLLARLRGKVTLTFSCRDVTENRELFPSSVVAPFHRPPAAPESFAPGEEERSLDLSEWWLWRMTGDERVRCGPELLETLAPHLARGLEAVSARRGSHFTAWDGYVPRAGRDLDPTKGEGMVLSANRLQTAGECPRKFFFRYVLGITPPEELAVDPSRWLDPLSRGRLLHDLFEKYVGEIVAQGRQPQFDRDLHRLGELLDEQIARYRELLPSPGESVFFRECASLRRTAEIFLREEERYWAGREGGALYLEAALGMPSGGPGTALDTTDPVRIDLRGGVSIRVRGRVDRIDRVGREGTDVAVWDYKTGSSRGYSRGDPHRQGRKIQPWLYVNMLTPCLRKAFSPEARVSFFGLFFPAIRAAGERIVWEAKSLRGGGEVVVQLCRIIADGIFVATNTCRMECPWCEYRPACGNVQALSEQTDRKVEENSNRALDPFRRLRPEKLRE